MNRLPDRVNLDHLKKQARDLIRRYRGGDPEAVARLLPVTSSRPIRLHDAQWCVAREYGFPSWADLKTFVEMQAAALADHAARVRRWLGFVYAGDITGAPSTARPHVAARMLAEDFSLATDSPYSACAVGDEAALRQATSRDPDWINRPGGPLHLPPLLAVTHSSLLQIPQYRDRLHGSAQFLLAAGADPNQSIFNRFPPASLEQPDHSQPLSALYGAVGSNRDPALTALLLEAGANPDDGESLYHSLENPDCTRLLLQHGARITGTNALYRSLDLESAEPLELLLNHGADANEPACNRPLTDWGCPLLWAIRRRRSTRHILALLAAGADPAATTPDGISAWRLALQFGLSDVAALLEQKTGGENLSEEEQFVAACTTADEPAARRLASLRPDLPAALPAEKLRLLPDLVSEGADKAARLMVQLGWPIAVRGGDWDASALNHAVFRGNADLARFLLQHGANWQERQGFGDDVRGTLSWASINEPIPGGDWAGCARALLDHGMPKAKPDGGDPELVVIDGHQMRFSEEVSDVLIGYGAV
jgi:ankyrin repeat protein